MNRYSPTFTATRLTFDEKNSSRNNFFRRLPRRKSSTLLGRFSPSTVMAPIKRNRLAVAAFVVTVAGAVATGVLLSCNAAQPGVNTLVLTVSERNIDNQGQQSTITVQATDSKGIPGKGQINLSATAGVFITPSTVTLSNGTASADFTCPLATDPNCTGLVDITATWVDKNNLTKTTTLTVGTSVSTRVTLYIVRLSV